MWRVCGLWSAQRKYIQIPALNQLLPALGVKLGPFVRGHPESGGGGEGQGGGGMTSITGL